MAMAEHETQTQLSMPCAGCWILIVDSEEGNCRHNWVVRIQTSYCRQEQWGHNNNTTVKAWLGVTPKLYRWIINQAPCCVVCNILRHLKDESIGFSHSFDSRETYPLQQNAGTVCQSLETPSLSVRRHWAPGFSDSGVSGPLSPKGANSI